MAKEKCCPGKKNSLDRADSLKSDYSGMIPLKPLDLKDINDFDEMSAAMALTAFGGRNFGEAVEVAYKMFSDKNCIRVGTFSGAMTPAKMSYLICDMIDSGMLQCVVSTGALITHGLVEGFGMHHYKSSEPISDEDAYMRRLNRIYDTYEPEDNLNDTEKILRKVVTEYCDKKLQPGEVLSSSKLTHIVGEHIDKMIEGKKGFRAILASAYRKNVPVIIPAFTDSEFGIDIAVFRMNRVRAGKPDVKFDPFEDLFLFRDLIKKGVAENKNFGIFTIGGGVPRNWAQQVAPLLDIIRERVDESEGCLMKYKYGVRICPEPAYWGGLSGCTYKEGVTWGKFESDTDEGGLYAEVLSDATIAWPFLLKAVKQRMAKTK